MNLSSSIRILLVVPCAALGRNLCAQDPPRVLANGIFGFPAVTDTGVEFTDEGGGFRMISGNYLVEFAMKGNEYTHIWYLPVAPHSHPPTPISNAVYTGYDYADNQLPFVNRNTGATKTVTSNTTLPTGLHSQVSLVDNNRAAVWLQDPNYGLDVAVFDFTSTDELLNEYFDTSTGPCYFDRHEIGAIYFPSSGGVTKWSYILESSKEVYYGTSARVDYFSSIGGIFTTESFCNHYVACGPGATCTISSWNIYDATTGSSIKSFGSSYGFSSGPCLERQVSRGGRYFWVYDEHSYDPDGNYFPPVIVNTNDGTEVQFSDKARGVVFGPSARSRDEKKFLLNDSDQTPIVYDIDSEEYQRIHPVVPRDIHPFQPAANLGDPAYVETPDQTMTLEFDGTDNLLINDSDQAVIAMYPGFRSGPLAYHPQFSQSGHYYYEYDGGLIGRFEILYQDRRSNGLIWELLSEPTIETITDTNGDGVHDAADMVTP